MLAMKNLAVITDAEASSKLKDETIARLEQEKAAQHSALMKDIAASRAQVLELGSKYDAEVAVHGKVRRRAEILEKDNADLKTEVNKLREEQIVSREETEKLMKEVKVEYERQLKGQVEAEYNIGYDQGYDDGIVDGKDRAYLDVARTSSSTAIPSKSNYGRVRSERTAPTLTADDLELGSLPLRGSNAEGIPSGEPIIYGGAVRTSAQLVRDDAIRAPPEIVNLEEPIVAADGSNVEPVIAVEPVGAQCVEQVVAGTVEQRVNPVNGVSIVGQNERENVRDDGARGNAVEQTPEGALSITPIAILPPLP